MQLGCASGPPAQGAAQRAACRHAQWHLHRRDHHRRRHRQKPSGCWRRPPGGTPQRCASACAPAPASCSDPAAQAVVGLCGALRRTRCVVRGGRFQPRSAVKPGLG
eukprot:363517-Chlamydomonas_euryale.AAC.10